jgi:heat shock protein HslJ
MRAFLLISFLLLSACTVAPGGRPMGGIAWRASDLNGVPLVPDSLLTLELQGGDRVSGSSGCNSYSGSYRLMNKAGIDFTALVSTRRHARRSSWSRSGASSRSWESVEGYTFYSDGGLS